MKIRHRIYEIDHLGIGRSKDLPIGGVRNDLISEVQKEERCKPLRFLLRDYTLCA
jgi:hypothetical protein